MLAPVGKLRLRRMLKDGLPQSLYLPLLYLLTGKTSEEEHALFERIENLRSASPGGTVAVVQSTTSSGEQGDPTLVRRDLKWLDQVTSMPAYWGAFLHLCANAVKAKTILELGCCLGISGCYLASSRSCNRFVTIEGSQELARLAALNLGRIVNHFQIIPALFDDGLDEVLPSVGAELDLVHIDGDHNEDRTLHYFQRIAPHLHAGSLVMFDDIYYSPGMQRAWRKLAQWNGAHCSVNVGRFGMILWDGENRRPNSYDLSLFAREWGKGIAEPRQRPADR